MELRPALLPPALDAALVARLSELADCLDGARPGQRDDELAEFNRLAGTEFPLTDFQGIYKSEDAEEFVRRVLFQQRVNPDPEITLTEMAEVISRVIECGIDHDFYLEVFRVNCRHPSDFDLIFWPDLVPELPRGREPTVVEIAALALRGSTEPNSG